MLAVAAGAVAYAAARRWPEPIEAPRVVQPTITAEVEQRPRLAELLRRRTDPDHARPASPSPRPARS